MSQILASEMNGFLVFVLVLSRIGGLVVTAPVFGSRSAPVRVRALLAVGVSFLIALVHQDTPVSDPGNLVNLLVMIGRENVLGMSLGVGVTILFTGLQLAGQVIGQMSGMQLADFFDPNYDANVPIVARILDSVSLTVFLVIGGHRQVMDALLDTFQEMPPGSGGFAPDLQLALTGILQLSFVVGLRVASPVMISLLMSILIMGLISRTLPQLNILAMGFSLNSMVMLATLSLSLGGVVWLFQGQLDITLESIRSSFQGAPPFALSSP